MTREEIVRGLRCSGSPGEKKCGGCPWCVREDVEGQDWGDCNVDQMALDAADLLENDRSQTLALQRELELKRAQLDCASASAEKLRRQNGELRDAAAQVTRLAGDAAAERARNGVEGRALRIAAVLMAEAGLCLYEDREQCAGWRRCRARCDCEGCLARRLRRKAKEELREENDHAGEEEE